MAAEFSPAQPAPVKLGGVDPVERWGQLTLQGNLALEQGEGFKARQSYSEALAVAEEMMVSAARAHDGRAVRFAPALYGIACNNIIELARQQGDGLSAGIFLCKAAAGFLTVMECADAPIALRSRCLLHSRYASAALCRYFEERGMWDAAETYTARTNAAFFVVQGLLRADPAAIAPALASSAFAEPSSQPFAAGESDAGAAAPAPSALAFADDALPFADDALPFADDALPVAADALPSTGEALPVAGDAPPVAADAPAPAASASAPLPGAAPRVPRPAASMPPRVPRPTLPLPDLVRFEPAAEPFLAGIEAARLEPTGPSLESTAASGELALHSPERPSEAPYLASVERPLAGPPLLAPSIALFTQGAAPQPPPEPSGVSSSPLAPPWGVSQLAPEPTPEPSPKTRRARLLGWVLRAFRRSSRESLPGLGSAVRAK